VKEGRKGRKGVGGGVEEGWRKEGKSEGRKEERKEGRKEKVKEGRKEGKEGGGSKKERGRGDLRIVRLWRGERDTEVLCTRPQLKRPQNIPAYVHVYI
jgi:hypothetical protein